MDYHQPVLLKESVAALEIKKDGVYVDATFGGGGHSRVILKQLGAKGRLFGFDQDEDVLPNVISENDCFTFIQHNFRYTKKFLRLHGVKQVDGILADLGVSSHQFDSAERGFSFRFDAKLDMRMNQQSEPTAADIINEYTADQLQSLFSKYGEVRNARTLAQTIERERKQKPITTIGEFLSIIQTTIRGSKNRYLAQVFQALRIEVNDEMGALTDFLEDAKALLKPGAPMVVISYHSLEDRMVKNFFKSGNVDGLINKDFYGNIDRPFKIITKKAIQPNEEEIAENPRARSAKMRIAKKAIPK